MSLPRHSAALLTLAAFDMVAPALRAAERYIDKGIEIAATVDMTRVTLHHAGLGDGDEQDKAYTQLDRAWGNVLGNVKKPFDRGPQDCARQHRDQRRRGWRSSLRGGLPQVLRGFSPGL